MVQLGVSMDKEIFMKYYLAPLEGITNVHYRNAYHQSFEPMDRYFAPFIPSYPNKRLTQKEVDDIHPDQNLGIPLVPQILSNRAQDTLSTLEQIVALGYEEVNLNFGCPSNTVSSKKKGSAFLYEWDALCVYLDEVFENAPCRLSIKTRLGKYAPEEFHRLAERFSQYPLTELIIHPRVQKDMYRNTPRLDLFKETFPIHNTEVCYNGDLFTLNDFKSLHGLNLPISACMMGRGILANPGLLTAVKTGKLPTIKQYRYFHDLLLESYAKAMPLDKHLLSKMKEFWAYLQYAIEDGKTVLTPVFKSQSLAEYHKCIDHLFVSVQWIKAPEEINQRFKQSRNA